MPTMLNGVNKSVSVMAASPGMKAGQEANNVVPEPKPIPTKNTPPPYRKHCNRQKERHCQDGSCVPRIELCPEEQLINQNTILIMIVVGIAVVVFVVILYCLQQRRRYRGSTHTDGEAISGHDDGDNVSLYQPPPSYDEVISTNLYPPTPSMLRLQMNNMGRLPEEVPITPPPNYDTALYILSRSQELTPTKPFSNRLVRRSISLSQVGSRENSHSPPSTPLENDVFCNNFTAHNSSPPHRRKPSES